MSVSQNVSVALTGQRKLAAAEIASIGKTMPAPSHQVQHEDNLFQETVFHGAFSLTQANESSTVPLLRHHMQDHDGQRADDGVRDSNVAATALRPHITASWTLLLDDASLSDSGLQSSPSITNAPVDKPYDSLASTLANSMPRGQHGIEGSHDRTRDPKGELSPSDMESKVSPLLRARADVGQVSIDSPVPPIHEAGPGNPPNPAGATSVTHTQISRPKMPSPSPASLNRLASLQAGGEIPKPMSLLERARVQQKAAPLLDALLGDSRGQVLPRKSEDTTTAPTPSSSVLSTLANDVPAPVGAADSVFAQATKLAPAAVNPGTSPLLQDRQVPDFLKEPTSAPRQRSRQHEQRPTSSWQQPTSQTDPWAHDTREMRETRREREAPGTRPPRFFAEPEEQVEAAPSPQHMSAMDMIKQMVQRDARPGQQLKGRCVSVAAAARQPVHQCMY